MMVIDFHTHCYPEKVVAKALSAVGDRLKPATDGTRAGLIASMREAGIDYSLALALVNNPANSRGVNRWAAEENRAPVFFTGSIHPADPDPEATLEFIAASGLKGIKLHPEYQGFEFSDERLFPLWVPAAVAHRSGTAGGVSPAVSAAAAGTGASRFDDDVG